MAFDKGTELSLDFLDAFDFEDFEELQGFDPFHPGTHLTTLHWSAAEKDGKKYVTAKFTLEETKELTDPNLKPQKQGFESSTTFALDSEYGRGFMRAACAPIKARYFPDGPIGYGALLEKSQGDSVIIATGVRLNKADVEAKVESPRKYLDLKSLAYPA
jgi:hypothetical protein